MADLGTETSRAIGGDIYNALQESGAGIVAPTAGGNDSLKYAGVQFKGDKVVLEVSARAMDYAPYNKETKVPDDPAMKQDLRTTYKPVIDKLRDLTEGEVGLETAPSMIFRGGPPKGYAMTVTMSRDDFERVTGKLGVKENVEQQLGASIASFGLSESPEPQQDQQQRMDGTSPAPVQQAEAAPSSVDNAASSIQEQDATVQTVNYVPPEPAQPKAPSSIADLPEAGGQDAISLEEGQVLTGQEALAALPDRLQAKMEHLPEAAISKLRIDGRTDLAVLEKQMDLALADEKNLDALTYTGKDGGQYAIDGIDGPKTKAAVTAQKQQIIAVEQTEQHQERIAEQEASQASADPMQAALNAAKISGITAASMAYAEASRAENVVPMNVEAGKRSSGIIEI